MIIRVVVSPSGLCRIVTGLFLCLAALAFSPGLYAADGGQVIPTAEAATASPGPSVPADESVPMLDARRTTLRVDIDLVQIPVTVTDLKNHPVLDLQKQDFSLYEENEPQSIRYFHQEDAPISIGLILDFSKSMTSKVETEREALKQFFNAANPEDDYFVITFADRPKVVANTTQSIGEIESKLATEVPEGNTALLDAVSLGVAKMRRARYQRRALLIISDGGDNHSRYRMKEIKSLVQEADVEIYAIGIFDTAVFKSFEEFMGKRWLQEITDATGGRTVTVDSLAKLPEQAANVSRELRSQYVLAFRPPTKQSTAGWRKIKVLVNRTAGAVPLQAFYRRSYWAPGR